MNTSKRAALIESSIQMVAKCGFHGASEEFRRGIPGGIPGTSMISFVKGKTEISLNLPD